MLCVCVCLAGWMSICPSFLVTYIDCCMQNAYWLWKTAITLLRPLCILLERVQSTYKTRNLTLSQRSISTVKWPFEFSLTSFSNGSSSTILILLLTYFLFSYDNRWNAEECAKHAWVSFVQNLAVISRCKWTILTEWSASVNLQRHRFVCVAVWRLRRMTLWRPCTVAATAKVHIWCVTGGCCRGMHNRPDQQLLKAKCCHACAFHGHTNRSLLHEQITVASEHCASIHSPRSIHRRQIALHFYYITRARFRAKYKRKNDLLACRHNADKSPHELDAQTEALTENAWHFFCDDATNWIQIEFEIKKKKLSWFRHTRGRSGIFLSNALLATHYRCRDAAHTIRLCMQTNVKENCTIFIRKIRNFVRWRQRQRRRRRCWELSGAREEVISTLLRCACNNIIQRCARAHSFEMAFYRFMRDEWAHEAAVATKFRQILFISS